MKAIKSLTIFVLALFATIISEAQNETDALRYSYLTFGGSARYMATGGAFGAAGAEFSTLSTNPAGIGLYKKSEFSFTPSVYFQGTESTYNGMKTDDSKGNFNFSNLGVVFAFDIKGNKSPWKHAQFGIGYNRIANFHSRYYMEGPNTTNSLMDEYINAASGTHFDNLNDYDTYLAWYTYLLDTAPGSTDQYISPVPEQGLVQRNVGTVKGAINEMVLTFGGNYDDRLYIAGTIGFPTIRYIEESTYSELDGGDSIAGFDQFTISDNLETRGSGVNFKFGLIYRFTDFLRLGAAVHTPTYYSMSDEYSRRIVSYFDDGASYDAESQIGLYDYRLTTPFRAIGSATVLFGKLGLLNAEYEYVDYSEARLRSDGPRSSDHSFTDVNNTISNAYTMAHNFRGGIEINLSPVMLRGGVSYYGSPYKSEINGVKMTNAERFVYSGGFGFRDANYFIDFAYSYSQQSEDYYLYSIVENPVANEKTSHTFLMTLGMKF